MEKKRKLPARAAARVEHVAKKRTVTPPEHHNHRSSTPVPAASQSQSQSKQQPAVNESKSPTELPKSIQQGKPLPTVEDAQPEDLPLKQFQNIQESGVLAESLQRSRHRWIAEGSFQKYWTKPSKKKGASVEENNPPKDSMSKLGPITITIEPHVFEATMWAVKDPKPVSTPTLPTTQAAFRPILQYGPPNGMMPPPPTPKFEPIPASPSVGAEPKPTPPPQSPAIQQASPAPTQQPGTAPSPAPAPASQPPRASPSQEPHFVPNLPSPGPSSAAASGSGPKALPGQAVAPATGAGPATSVVPQASRPVAPPLAQSPSTPSSTPGGGVLAAPGPPPAPGQAPPPATNATPSRGPSSASPAPSSKTPNSAKGPNTNTDPIILLLAERASQEAPLRDLMRRVASGEATDGELGDFQYIIDQITVEYKRKGGKQGPSADRLIVDGKTVKWYCDEARDVLDVVLRSNPQAKSRGLVPPRNHNPLVIGLVKAALDDQATDRMLRGIAGNNPQPLDAADVKSILDGLYKNLQSMPKPSSQPQAQGSHAVNGGVQQAGPASSAAHQHQHQHQPHPSQQALRSKGPLPVSTHKSDITAIALEFAGGNGDRYLFPKFSILEFLPGGQHAIASFLIVRKGSQLEYGGDAKLDYYQPVTVRLYAPTGRHLEQLRRVVAPPDEVARYMDDVMDNMTRAEYVILAMRLPRGDPSLDKDREKDKEKDKEKEKGSREATNTNGATAGAGGVKEEKSGKLPRPPPVSAPPTKPPVLWKGAAKRFLREFPNKGSYDTFMKSRKSGRDGTLTMGRGDVSYLDVVRYLGLPYARDGEGEAEYEYEMLIEKLTAKQSDEEE